MTKAIRLAPIGAAAALLALAGTAQADVTPRDVWSQWQQYLQGFGYSILAEPIEEGADLRVPDLRMSIPIPADPESGAGGGTMTFSMGEIALTDLGDGTVSVDIPQSVPIKLTSEGMPEGSFEMEGRMTSAGYTTIASGNPGDISYEYAAEQMDFIVDRLTGPKGEGMMPDAMSFGLTGATGSSRITEAGDAMSLDQTLAAERLTYNVDVSQTEGDKPGHLRMQGSYAGIEATSAGMLPDMYDPLDMGAALADGYDMRGGMTFTTGQTNLDFSEPEQSARFTSTSQGGAFSAAISAAGLVYNLSASGIDFSLESDQVPFPIATSIKSAGFALEMPVISGDDPQDFTARLLLTEVAVPDPIWMMMDPGNSLPHEPLTAEIETSGQARLFVDIFDPTRGLGAQTGGTQPGELTALTLDRLLLKAGGATVAAAGAFDIDNSARSMLNPDLPAFSGSLDLRLTGVTTLLSQLGQMGLIPLPQAMMASGMIQQLGKPESGPDDLSAKIDVTKGGGVTINGAPLPLR